MYFNKRWWCEQKCKLAASPTTPSCNNIPFKSSKQINVTIQEKAANTDYQKGILDGSLVANYLLPLTLRFLLRTTMHRSFFVYSIKMLIAILFGVYAFCVPQQPGAHQQLDIVKAHLISYIMMASIIVIVIFIILFSCNKTKFYLSTVISSAWLQCRLNIIE